MPPPRPELSDAELRVLKVLWNRGSGTARDVLEELRGRWAYNTVLTLLMRLKQKGYVASEKPAAAHVFRPLVSRDELMQQRLERVARELCDGAATPLVRALVEGKALSADDVAELRRLLDEQPPPRQRRGKTKKQK